MDGELLDGRCRVCSMSRSPIFTQRRSYLGMRAMLLRYGIENSYEKEMGDLNAGP